MNAQESVLASSEADPEATHKQYVCRVGSILLEAPTRSKDRIRQAEAVKKAIEGDTRVISADFPRKPSQDFTTYFKAFRRQQKTEEIASGDPFWVLRFDRPIIFNVFVPIKNQPLNQGADDIPTDTYWVAWDGALVVVTWEQEKKSVPRSGGHVILDILRDAARSIGMDVYNQACSPGCKNIFTHTSLIVAENAELDHGESKFIPAVRRTPTLQVHQIASSKVVARNVFGLLVSAGGDFWRLKNRGRRILDLETSAWETLECLLGVYEQRTALAALPWWTRKGLRSRWNGRGWRKRIREHSARIWLLITTIEHLARQWSEDRRRFNDKLAESDVISILKPDFSEDEAAITSLELGRLESLSGQVESRLDNRIMSWATVGGAIAGAIAGAAASYLH